MCYSLQFQPAVWPVPDFLVRALCGAKIPRELINAASPITTLFYRNNTSKTSHLESMPFVDIYYHFNYTTEGISFILLSRGYFHPDRFLQKRVLYIMDCALLVYYRMLP